MKLFALGLLALLPSLAIGQSFTAQPVIPYAATTGTIATVTITAAGITARCAVTPLAATRQLAVQAYSATGGAAQALMLTTSDEPGDVAVADCDGDGREDIVVAGTANRTVQIFYQDASGGFAASAPIQLPQIPLRVTVGDLDVTGNSLPEIVVATIDTSNPAPFPNQLLICQATSARTYAAPERVARASSSGAVTGLAIATFNTIPCVVLIASSGISVGAPITRTESIVPMAGLTNMAVGDVTADGLADIVVGRAGVTAVLVFAGAVNGYYGTPITLPILAEVDGVTVDDVNRDGVNDIVATMKNRSDVALLIGTAAGPLSAATYVAAGISSGSIGDVAVGDVSGDGQVDILLQNYGVVTGGATVLLLNTTAIIPTATLLKQQLSTLVCYPNPNAGSFRVAGLLPGEQVRILDIVGRTVLERQAIDGAVVLAPGLYVVEAYGSVGVRRGRVIVK